MSLYLYLGRHYKKCWCLCVLRSPWGKSGPCPKVQVRLFQRLILNHSQIPLTQRTFIIFRVCYDIFTFYYSNENQYCCTGVLLFVNPTSLHPLPFQGPTLKWISMFLLFDLHLNLNHTSHSSRVAPPNPSSVATQIKKLDDHSYSNVS
jgi:hypothetical protein